MKHNDLTIVYYSSSHLDIANPGFLSHTHRFLLEAAMEIPILYVTQKPMPFPLREGDRNIVIGEIGRSHLNIYRQLLIGALHAESPWIASAEDDVLYAPSHFRTHRPPAHRFAFNVNRWGVNCWVDPPLYGYRNRHVVNQLIAPRKLLIDALNERFDKFRGVPDEEVPIKHWGDPGRYEKELGVTVRESEAFASPDPSVVFSHQEAFGFLNHGKRKSVGQFPRTELPYWGTAQRMLDLWSLPNLATTLDAQPTHIRPNSP